MPLGHSHLRRLFYDDGKVQVPVTGARGVVVVAVACALLLVVTACGRDTSHRSQASPTGTASGDESSWPVPATGDDVVAVMARMPRQLGGLSRVDDSPGRAYYGHTDGMLGVEAAEIVDMFAEDIEPAEAVRRIEPDLDDGARSCGTRSVHCLLGTLDGHPHMVWTRDGSEVVLVATWPDEKNRLLLHDAWLAAQE